MRGEKTSASPRKPCAGACRIILRIRRNLGNSDMPRGPCEFPELPVCHGMTVHPEAVHDAMCRGFFGCWSDPMRKVPPGIQIIFSMSAEPPQMAGSGLSLGFKA